MFNCFMAVQVSRGYFGSEKVEAAGFNCSMAALPKTNANDANRLLVMVRDTFLTQCRNIAYTIATNILCDGDSTGWGFSIWRGQREMAHGCGRPRDGEVFDAEAIGAMEGLRHALSLPGIREVTACVDNQAVIWCLARNPPKSSTAECQEWHRLADAHGHPVNIRWSPGHMDIAGKERADRLAAEGAKQNAPYGQPSLARIR